MSDKRRRRKENSDDSEQSESEDSETKNEVDDLDVDKDEGVVSEILSYKRCSHRSFPLHTRHMLPIHHLGCFQPRLSRMLSLLSFNESKVFSNELKYFMCTQMHL